ncbi:MAG: hypothetical protein QM765_46905 [Myxococcales bacterium]
MAPITEHAAAHAAPPAADLAQVTHRPGGSTVRLPPEFSRATVVGYFERMGIPGRVVMGPADIDGVGSIGPEQWAVIADGRSPRFLSDRAPVTFPSDPRLRVFVFPKHTVVVPAGQVWWLQVALERVKPERFEADGRPASWVPPVPRSAAPALDPNRDGDATIGEAGSLPEAEPLEAEAPGTPVPSSAIRDWFAALCASLGLPEIPLVVRRGQEDARGQVRGSVVMTADFAPLRVCVTTCPNSDQAEVLATLVHELAHPLSRSTDHGSAFRSTLVDLAARLWGEPHLAGARAHVDGAYPLLDRWVTCGIRAALAGREPPASKVCDDGHAARVVGKVAKLWALAADQLGKPEGVGAAAMANDLVTVYGLDQSQVFTTPSFDDGLVDRYVLLQPRKPWQRTLAHEVAYFSNVYSLSMDSEARMHFFGRYSDVVAAEYLCGVSIGRIERECAAYLERCRASLAKGELRRAGLAFCESAAHEFGRKLHRILEEEARAAGRAVQSAALNEATDFAEHQLELRGFRVGKARAREVRYSAVGAELGKRMEVVRGLDSQGAAPRSLPGRK